jgi:S1-C subfamily serine protease
MKKKISFLRGMLLFAMALCLIVSPLSASLTVSAANDSTPAVAAARDGVLQINLVYQDNNGNRTVLKTGSGFLVGPASGARTVITNYHVVHLNDEEKQWCTQTFGVDFNNQNSITLLIQVVVKRDIKIDATYKNGSEIGDYAVIQLSDSIYDRAPLKLSNSDNLSETQSVYALGFPFTASWVSDDQTYVSSDVTITNGIVGKFQNINNIPYVLHNAGLSAGNSGGPLVNSNGCVVGVNTMYAGDDYGNNYYYSIAINEIKSTLDALGIVYETEDESGSSSGNNGQSTIENTPAPTSSQSESEPEPTTRPRQNDSINDDILPEQNSDNTMLIIIIVAVAVILLIVIVIVIIAVAGKNKRHTPNGYGGAMPQPMPMPAPAPAPTPAPAPAPAPRPMPMPPSYSTTPVDSGAGETGLLGLGAGETGVLGGASSQIPASLTRLKNNETISIGKPSFAIGKERARVDYCVPDNNSVSRVHVHLTYRNGDYFITDNNSTNYTFINGNKIAPKTETKLQSGDKIKLADEEFVIRF